jgi:hypothetical protein
MSEVYFISCEWGTLGRYAVKIGFARNPKAKMRVMQVGCPYDLHLLGVMEGGREMESKLHHRFAEHRIRGEWFNLSLEIRQFIKGLAGGKLAESL